MSSTFVIYDEMHWEPQGEFPDMATAVTELRSRSHIPWDQEPNRAPCMSWRTCHRIYEIHEYAQARPYSDELRRVKVLDVSAAGVNWFGEFAVDP